MKSLFRIMFVCLLGFVALMWLVGSHTDQNTKNEAHAAAYQSMPQIERSFLEAVQNARKAYREAANDMAKGATRPARAADVCAVMKSAKVSDWTGVISKLSSNNDGKGVLLISIGEDVYLGTWNNSISDTGDHTLIDPNSGLFKQASTMSEGNLVRFSGTFLPSDVDCLREMSLTLSGSLTEPSYVFRFASISSLDQSSGKITSN